MTESTPGRRSKGELALRLASAAVLIPFALFVVWAGGWWLVAGCTLFALAMGYEWARMTAFEPAGLLILAASLACPLAYLFGGGIGAGALAVGALICAALARGSLDRRLSAALGVVYTGVIPLALFSLREGPWDGQSAALIFMAIVWASDAAAYFTGRGIGGPLLSPKDSPNKTWSGAIGAVIATSLAGAIAAYLLSAPVELWIVAGAVISVVAQVGDMQESQIKRFYGVKDVSGLVPGHGGVMDRVDGLGAVCVVSVMLFVTVPSAVDLLGLSR